MMISNAINNMEDIHMIIDAFSVVDNLTQDGFYKNKKYFYANYDRVISLGVARAPYGTPRSNLRITLRKLVISRRFS